MFFSYVVRVCVSKTVPLTNRDVSLTVCCIKFNVTQMIVVIDKNTCRIAMPIVCRAMATVSDSTSRCLLSAFKAQVQSCVEKIEEKRKLNF